MAQSQQKWAYNLAQLYEDQYPEYALDSIPHLICWIDPKNRQSSHRFELREHGAGSPINHELNVSWDVASLVKRDPRLEADLHRFRAGRTLTGEDHTKYAAYGLALVAVSCVLKRRIEDVSFYRSPDLLLDVTAGALRGVEVAGRTSKGYSAFAQACDGIAGKRGKRAQLMEHQDVVEGYLSLWCSEPKVSIWEKVKP